MRNSIRRSGKVTAATARKVTGFSTPLGGIQWSDSGPGEAEIARRFLAFLEDRHVLYNPFDIETESEVEHSNPQIRKECTKTLQALSADAFAATPLRTTREAGRQSTMISASTIDTSTTSGVATGPARHSSSP